MPAPNQHPVPVVMGIDPSLTSTGLAIIAPSGRVQALRRIVTKPSGDTIRDRLHRLQRIIDQIPFNVPSLAVIEGPSYGNRHGHQHDRAGLWWQLVGTLHAHRCTILEVPPTVRAKYATGKGTAGKDAVIAATVRRFPTLNIDGNDVADALTLAAIGRRLLGHPIDDPMPKVNLAALDKLTSIDMEATA